MKKSSKLSLKSREFKPSKKPAPVAAPPAQPESKYFKGLLPGQGGNSMPMPPPSLLPPGMTVGFESGGLTFSKTMPEGLKKLFQQAYDEGKLDDIIMQQLYENKKENDDDDDMHQLTAEEEAFAAEFMKEQKQVDICPYYLEGKCIYGKK